MRLGSVIALVGLCLCIGLRCEEGVHPILGDERPFTLWGFLDAGADTQRVRVIALVDQLGAGRSGPIDAVVTSTDLDTGERREWVDSEVFYADSTFGHVFWSAFRAEPEHRYRLDVRRSDGATSSVEVTVPVGVAVEPSTRVLDMDHIRNNIIPVVIAGELENIVGLEVEYDVLTQPPGFPWPPGSPQVLPVRLQVVVPYGDELERTATGGHFDIDLQRDYGLIEDAFESVCVSTLSLAFRAMELRFVIANDQWAPPGGSFDPDVLIEPGAFSNVENGYGFFGAGAAFDMRWILPASVRAGLGFVLNVPCANGPQDIPECQQPTPPCFE